jgi:hypothetical protein
MRASGWKWALLLGAFASFGGVGSAEAEIFISATGKDTNNCSRTTPCRTDRRQR